MTKRISRGDLVEVVTADGRLSYLQVAERHPLWFHIVRVLPGRYERRPSDLGQLVAQPEEYLFATMVNLLIEKGLGEVVGRVAVPPEVWKSRLLREGAVGPVGEAGGWRLVNEDLTTRLERPLADDEMRLPSTTIEPPVAIPLILAGFRDHQPSPAELEAWKNANGHAATVQPEPSISPGPGEVAHTAYFGAKRGAVNAKLELQRSGFVCLLSQRPEGSWQVVAIGSFQRHGSIDDQWVVVDKVVRAAGGTYEGRETNVRSL